MNTYDNLNKRCEAVVKCLPDAPFRHTVAGIYVELFSEIDGLNRKIRSISELADHQIPGYAYGDNEAADEIESLRSMYNAQCACTDEWAEKYRAEVERKADATLLERVAELEQALAAVNARLAKAQALTPNVL